MPLNLHKQFIYRLWLLIFVFLLLFISLLTRLFFLQIINYSFFKEKTIAQQQKSIKIPAKRGNILDTNGKVLATSIDTVSLYATPLIITDKKLFAEKISPILKMDSQKIIELIANDKHFVWLERKIDPQTAFELKEMHITGLGFIDEQKRIYPHKAFAAHALGFVGIDDCGLGGIEQYFDKELCGEPGQMIVDKTPYGEEIHSGLRSIHPAIQGQDIQLTIDEFIQFAAEKALKKAIQKSSAQKGSILITNPRTGEILALACYPAFDPNLYFQSSETDRINTTIQTVFEPGSTFKAIPFAAAWNENIIDENSSFYNGKTFTVGDKEINDHHTEKTINLYAAKTPAEILAYSLNIGTAKIGLALGKEKLYRYIQDFGFGKITGIELAGESGGIVHNYQDWTEADEGIIPFGQGIAVTPLQLISAINVIGNGGTLLKPILVKKITAPAKNKTIFEAEMPQKIRRVISIHTSQKILELMKETVDRGTGVLAQIKGYSVAGKTGTAEKPDPHNSGYIPNEYIASFIGLVPANQPHISILVIIDTPRRGSYYGGSIAAPVFKEVAEATIQYLGIPPDRDRVLTTLRNTLPDAR